MQINCSRMNLFINNTLIVTFLLVSAAHLSLESVNVAEVKRDRKGDQMSHRYPADQDGGCIRLSHVTKECKRRSTSALMQISRDWKRNSQHSSETCRELESIVTACFPDLRPNGCVMKIKSDKQRQERSEWLSVMTAMLSSCESISTNDFIDTSCFRQEFSGLLWKIYDSEYNFNINQVPQGRCRFLAESFKCKHSLVLTSCGEEDARILTIILKLLENRKPRQQSCSGVENSLNHGGMNITEYKGFQYSRLCSKMILTRYSDCNLRFLSMKKRLKFHAENSLIVSGEMDDVNLSCSLYDEYNRCTDAVRHSCPSYVQLMQGFDADTRVYLNKLDTICNKKKSAYIQSLGCFQLVMNQKLLSSCDQIWESIQTHLNKVSAYEFYCSNNVTEAKLLASELRRLRFCHTTIFQEKCGSVASQLMSYMLESAFKDPFYLRLSQLPDCQLLNEIVFGAAELTEYSNLESSSSSGNLASQRTTDSELGIITDKYSKDLNSSEEGKSQIHNSKTPYNIKPVRTKEIESKNAKIAQYSSSRASFPEFHVTRGDSKGLHGRHRKSVIDCLVYPLILKLQPF